MKCITNIMFSAVAILLLAGGVSAGCNSLTGKGCPAPTAEPFVPTCNCACCSIQQCDGHATDLCEKGEKLKEPKAELPGATVQPKCMLARKSKLTDKTKCDSWVDENFIPMDCNPTDAWKRQAKAGNAP